MRGRVDGLQSPFPVLFQLPGVYQEEGFTERFVGAFDDSLAPLVSSLDNLATYVDPDLTPPDFLAWLAGWVAVDLDDQTRTADLRRAVRASVPTHRRRGTRLGLREVVSHLTGAQVEVTDSGGAIWSVTPGTPLPGDPDPVVRIRVLVDDLGSLDRSRLEAVVRSAKPVHVADVIEVTEVTEVTERSVVSGSEP
ncbi:hypothetical protein BA895_06755 [Humibacillus sp. DSM 29435]|nr:hypothetical protein BA895_06755 [Humibacillus sp. DSM 29435]